MQRGRQVFLLCLPFSSLWVPAVSQCVDKDANVQIALGNSKATCAALSLQSGACDQASALCPVSCKACNASTLSATPACTDRDDLLQQATGNTAATCSVAAASASNCAQLASVCPKSCNTCGVASPSQIPPTSPASTDLLTWTP